MATAAAIFGTQGIQGEAALDDVATVEVGSSVTHDSNPLRVSDSANPQSDTIYNGLLGLHVNKPYAQQRFQLDAAVTAYRYDKNSYLDYHALSYRAAWLWHYGPRVSGTLEANESTTQIPFQDTNTTIRNLRTTKNYIFNADAEMSSSWHFLAGIVRSDQSNEVLTQGQPDFNSTTAEAGVTYFTLSGNSAGFVQRLTTGNYVNVNVDPNNPINDDFRGYESDFQGKWVLTGKSSLTGRLGWLDRRSENFSKFDFSGLVGNANYIWTPTAKIRVELGAQRNITAWQDDASTHRVDNGISFTPTWQPSAKIALHMRLEHIQSYYEGGVLPATGEARWATSNNALLGAEWSPVRALTTGASVARETRSSNDITYQYQATVMTLTAGVKF
jgi:exopolysaccharide biosynthesis operon protein EpsL